MIAVRSVPGDMSGVMSMRLGLAGDSPGTGSTPEQVSERLELRLEQVRELESIAWETVQRARSYSEIRSHYEANR